MHIFKLCAERGLCGFKFLNWDIPTKELDIELIVRNLQLEGLSVYVNEKEQFLHISWG